MLQKQNGFSFMELMITFFIAAILMTLSVGGFSLFFRHTESQLAGEKLYQAIQTTRNQALLSGMSAILCPSQHQKICGKNWKEGWIIFVGKKRVWVEHPVFPGELHWRAFHSSSNQLQFFPSGFLNAQNGTFWYCDKNEKNPAWAIVINQTGRVRMVYPDSQGEVHEESGEKLVCLFSGVPVFSINN